MWCPVPQQNHVVVKTPAAFGAKDLRPLKSPSKNDDLPVFGHAPVFPVGRVPVGLMFGVILPEIVDAVVPVVSGENIDLVRVGPPHIGRRKAEPHLSPRVCGIECESSRAHDPSRCVVSNEWKCHSSAPVHAITITSSVSPAPQLILKSIRFKTGPPST